MIDPDTSTRKQIALIVLYGFFAILAGLMVAMFYGKEPNSALLAIVAGAVGLLSKDVNAVLQRFFPKVADDDTPPDSTRSTTSTVTSSTTSNPTQGVPTK